MKIPQVPQISPGAVGSAPRFAPGPAVVPAVAVALDRTAEMLGRLQEEADHDALVEAQAKYAETMSAYSLEAEQQRQGAAARGFAQDYAAKHEDMVERLTADSPMSRRAAKAFGVWARGRKVAGMESAASYEHNQMKLHAADMHTLRVQSVVAEAGRNPAAFPDLFGQLEESYALAVGQGLYRPEEAKAKLFDTREKLKVDVFENLYAQNRGLAMKSLDALGFDQSQKARAHKRLQADMRHEAAVAAAARRERLGQLAEGLEDVDYLAAQTGDVRGLRDIAGKFAALGEGKRAEALRRRADMYEERVEVIGDSRGMDLPALAERIKGIDTELAGAGNDAHKHRLLSQEREIRAKIFEARATQFEKDPAAAADSLLPEMKRTPAELAAARLEVQERNGVSPYKRQALTRAEAGALKDAWAGTDDAQQRAGLLLGVTKEYGPHAGRALVDIGLPDGVVGLSQVLPLMPVSSATRLIAAADAKEADLPQLDAAGKRDVRERVAGSKMMGVLGAVSDKMYSSREQQMFATRLGETLENYVRLGGDIGEIEGQYTLINDSGMAIMMPKGLPEKDVEDGLDYLRSELLFKLREPVEDEAKEYDRRCRRDMYRNGTWVWDGKGFAMVDAASGRLAVDESGALLRVEPAALKDLAAKSRRTAYDRDLSATGHMPIYPQDRR